MVLDSMLGNIGAKEGCIELSVPFSGSKCKGPLRQSWKSCPVFKDLPTRRQSAFRVWRSTFSWGHHITCSWLCGRSGAPLAWLASSLLWSSLWAGNHSWPSLKWLNTKLGLSFSLLPAGPRRPVSQDQARTQLSGLSQHITHHTVFLLAPWRLFCLRNTFGSNGVRRCWS